MQFTIRDYPHVIEPTVDVLEVVVSTDSQAATWTQLHRVSSQTALQSMAWLADNAPQLFGPTVPAGTVYPFLLAYTSGGRLEKILQYRDGFWDVLPLPEEVTGEKVTMPSVRLVFKTERARAAFLRHIEQIIDQKVNNPALAVVLDQLHEKPFLVDVWRDKPT